MADVRVLWHLCHIQTLLPPYLFCHRIALQTDRTIHPEALNGKSPPSSNFTQDTFNQCHPCCVSRRKIRRYPVGKCQPFRPLCTYSYAYHRDSGSPPDRACRCGVSPNDTKDVTDACLSHQILLSTLCHENSQKKVTLPKLRTGQA